MINPVCEVELGLIFFLIHGRNGLVESSYVKKVLVYFVWGNLVNELVN